MLTTERSQSSGIIAAAMPETQDVDVTSWSEADFEEKCTYFVKDQPLEEESVNDSRTRAERSLPRNLALKRGHNTTAEVIIKQTFLVYLSVKLSKEVVSITKAGN